ncbi:membrane-associated protein [Aliidiomarina halalkaliphila]|uniref:Membrane-associated protein n=1 Tax=Aliidiomarina halalkaliphila TaxID=2593535 RepID=A0A552X4X8_9GAMM|nr:membrane-associated protein [Aliidiomarina halalkaliphila]TRW49999.1 membrane-associated protein [Aliidiomarina halalkaliphila]
MALLNFKSEYQHSGSGKDIPLWMKLGFTLIALVVLVVWWDYMGPANYLWFSDVALIVMVPALWLGNRLIASTMAVAVLIPELVWVLDFITLSHFTVIASYMFNPEMALYIRFLSATFHIALPIVMFYMLYRLGYDQRALPLQSLIALIVLPITYLVSEPSANINWVYGPGAPQDFMNPWLYLLLLWVAFVVVIYIPTHLLLKRFFSKSRVS